MEDTRKTVLAGNGEKDVPRAVYDGVLTIDVDAQVESMEEQEEARWHQLLNAHRTRKILTGQLRGIEKLESGWMVAVTYFNGFRIIIPMNEMMINLQGDGRENADTLNRQVRIATNGKDVARLLVDEYLNCHPTGHKKFMESMAKEQQEIKDNYTYLGFAWLKGLSEVRYYDLRNEASKLMADDLCLHVKEQPERVRLVYEGAEEMEINPSDEEQMAKMFTCYLLAGSMDGYGEFVDYALDTHRTLQQNLTRFFVEWFAKAEKGSAFLKRAKMVYSRYSLPYI